MSKSNDIIVIDVETGGFNPRKNPITQIAAKGFRSDTFEEIFSFSCYIKPYNNLEIEESALNATGVNITDVLNGLKINDAISELQSNFKKIKDMGSNIKKPILLGHNIGFDIGFLNYAFDSVSENMSKNLDGFNIPFHKGGKGKDSSENYKEYFIPYFFDTLRIARIMWSNDPTVNKFDLTTCCRKAQLEEFDAHDAMNDVIATKDLFLFFLNKMRNGYSVELNKEQYRFREFFQF